MAFGNALVIDSKIVFRDKSSRNGIKGDCHAKLVMKYKLEGRRVETEVRGQWRNSDISEGDKRMLEAGGLVPLRVDPKALDFGSLIELTGHP